MFELSQKIETSDEGELFVGMAWEEGGIPDAGVPNWLGCVALYESSTFGTRVDVARGRIQGNLAAP
jgi:hypothetical protein